MDSPLIDRDGWGSLEVGGLRFKDAMLAPGWAVEWDWRESGTSHEAGIQQSEIVALLEKGADQIVVGRGREQLLTVPESALDPARRQGVAVEVLETSEAIRRYNQLASAGVAVGALIHSTC